MPHMAYDGFVWFRPTMSGRMLLALLDLCLGPRGVWTEAPLRWFFEPELSGPLVPRRSFEDGFAYVKHTRAGVFPKKLGYYIVCLLLEDVTFFPLNNNNKCD